MFLKLKSPIVFFDLETTGVNISKDRIVELAMIKVLPSNERIIKEYKVNPTVPIPKEVSAIHGIFEKDIRDAPTFKQIAKSLHKFLEGCDLSGFNILKFDVPILVEEFLRVGVDFNVEKRRILDSQKIFHLMEKRNLKAALKFYTGKDLIGAHGALADTNASLEVFEAQIKRYENKNLTDLLDNKIGTIVNDMNVIHDLTNSKMIDLAGRLIYNAQGVEVFNFGKHKGRPVSEVLKHEPSFYDWMMKGDFPMNTKKKLTQLRLRNYNN